MGTITQEIDRINGGKNSIIESTNIKLEAQGSQPIPANTKIDEISPYIDAIQQGGEENLFMQSTDLTYMFYFKDLTDSKNFDGLKRFSQNNVTVVYDTFRSANYQNQEDYDKCLEYISKILTNTTLTDMSYALYGFVAPTYLTPPQEVPLLDLSNLNISGSALSAFAYAFTSTSNSNRYLKIKFKKDCFKNCTNVERLFQQDSNNATNITIILEDNEFDISNSTFYSYFMQGFNGQIEDFNGNITNILNLKLRQTGTTFGLGYVFTNCINLERVNFDNTLKCSSFQNMLSRCTNLKSVTGLNFGSNNYTNLNPFGDTVLNYFGELGIINGSTLGTKNSVNLDLHVIWNANKSTVRDGQTIEYWYEKFANALGNKAATGTQTITISSALYNSLTKAQIELITNKGYILASA